MSNSGKKNLTKSEKRVRTVKRAVKVVKAGSFFYNKILPWILVAFAALAYAFLEVPIPEKKVRTKYKETW